MKVLGFVDLSWMVIWVLANDEYARTKCKALNSSTFVYEYFTKCFLFMTSSNCNYSFVHIFFKFQTFSEILRFLEKNSKFWKKSKNFCLVVMEVLHLYQPPTLSFWMESSELSSVLLVIFWVSSHVQNYLFCKKEFSQKCCLHSKNGRLIVCENGSNSVLLYKKKHKHREN